MDLQHAPPQNELFSNSTDEKLKTAEEVLDALRKEAAENDCKWLEENLEVSMEAVKERRGVR